MLRASGNEADLDVKLRGVTDPSVPTGVPAGDRLIAFTDALISGTDAELDRTRAELAGIVGDQGAAMAAGVAANFQMMNRVLDATGAPTPMRRVSLAADLGLDPKEFGHGHGRLTRDDPSRVNS